MYTHIQKFGGHWLISASNFIVTSFTKESTGMVYHKTLNVTVENEWQVDCLKQRFLFQLQFVVWTKPEKHHGSYFRSVNYILLDIELLFMEDKYVHILFIIPPSLIFVHSWWWQGIQDHCFIKQARMEVNAELSRWPQTDVRMAK